MTERRKKTLTLLLIPNRIHTGDMTMTQTQTQSADVINVTIMAPSMRKAWQAICESLTLDQLDLVLDDADNDDAMHQCLMMVLDYRYFEPQAKAELTRAIDAHGYDVVHAEMVRAIRLV